MNIEWLIISKMVLYAVFLWPKKKVNYKNILECIPVGGIFTEHLFHVLYISGYIPEESQKWKACFYNSLTEMARKRLIYYGGQYYVHRA